jgi:hypothetical protein
MYIQGIQTQVESNSKFVLKRFDKYNEMFEIARNVVRGTDLRDVRQELMLYRQQKYESAKDMMKEEANFYFKLKNEEAKKKAHTISVTD